MGPKKRFAILKRDRFQCAYCGRRPPEVELHVDHRVPRAAGGTDDDANLVAACVDCNTGKGADYDEAVIAHTEGKVGDGDRFRRLRLRRAWDCWRMTIGTGLDRVEVTCLRDEVDAIADWLEEHGAAAQRLPLPVAEHELRSTFGDYRWTARAWDRCEKREIRTGAGRRNIAKPISMETFAARLRAIHGSTV